MKLKDMSKDDLELLSYKDITYYILEEKGKINTVDLFNKIIKLLELPSSTFDKKVGDYYASLTNDKRFLFLEDGTWDLRTRHHSKKAIIMIDDEDDEIDEIKDDSEHEIEENSDDFDSIATDDEDDFDDSDDDLKDLVVLDEDELELEQ